jgi:hypothetical protein
MDLKSKIIEHSTHIYIFISVNVQKIGDENLSEKLSAETEFCKIGPRWLMNCAFRRNDSTSS